MTLIAMCVLGKLADPSVSRVVSVCLSVSQSVCLSVYEREKLELDQTRTLVCLPHKQALLFKFSFLN